jgi:ubiquitin-protein ligase
MSESMSVTSLQGNHSLPIVKEHVVLNTLRLFFIDDIISEIASFYSPRYSKTLSYRSGNSGIFPEDDLHYEWIMMMHGSELVKMGLMIITDSPDMYTWHVSIRGFEGSVYEHGWYALEIAFHVCSPELGCDQCVMPIIRVIDHSSICYERMNSKGFIDSNGIMLNGITTMLRTIMIELRDEATRLPSEVKRELRAKALLTTWG